MISWVNNSMDVGDIQLSVNVLMVSEYFPVQKYVIHIYVTQIDVQSLIDVQSSNPCPISMSQTSVPQIYVLFFKLTSNYVTSIRSDF